MPGPISSLSDSHVDPLPHSKTSLLLLCLVYILLHAFPVRKHFVRHHESWLTEMGCNVDIWRKSCAPIGRSLAAEAAAAAAGGGSRARKPSAAAAAAAAAMAAGAGHRGSSNDLAAAAAAGAVDGGVDTQGGAAAGVMRSGRQNSTRLPDGESR
jgi:hypothetical protein